MIRYSKLSDNILTLMPDAENYLKSREDVLFAYLFGSLAEGKVRPLSDVDIAIYLSSQKSYFERKLQILGNLMDLLQTDEVDLVVLNSAPITLIMNIIKNKIILVDKDHFLRHRFESLAMRQYFDFSILEAEILEKRFLHG